MLAEEIKIKALTKQIKFIKKQLENTLQHREDGDPSYVYIGYVFPETEYYFKKEGFSVTEIKSDRLIPVTGGYPAYLFVPNTELSDEIEQLLEYVSNELEKDAEKHDTEEDDYEEYYIEDDEDL